MVRIGIGLRQASSAGFWQSNLHVAKGGQKLCFSVSKIGIEKKGTPPFETEFALEFILVAEVVKVKLLLMKSKVWGYTNDIKVTTPKTMT